MDAIFEYIRDKDGVSEIFKTGNGIPWSSETETRFSAGSYEEGIGQNPVFAPLILYLQFRSPVLSYLNLFDLISTDDSTAVLPCAIYRERSPFAGRD